MIPWKMKTFSTRSVNDMPSGVNFIATATADTPRATAGTTSITSPISATITSNKMNTLTATTGGGLGYDLDTVPTIAL